MNNIPYLLHKFKTDINQIELPTQFTFPFVYEPHEIAITAAHELQDYLTNNENWFLQMGVNQKFDGEQVGKMFGVLVVENSEKEIGHIWAVSGKLSDNNKTKYFVPPIVDLMEEEGFYRSEEPKIVAITHEIYDLENSGQKEKLKASITETKQSFDRELRLFKDVIQVNKTSRSAKRKALLKASSLSTNIPSHSNSNTEPLSNKELSIKNSELNKKLNQESMNEKFELKLLKDSWNSKITEQQKLITTFEDQIQALKSKRKEMSNALQQLIFDQYGFLDFNQEYLNLSDCFKNEANPTPPSGSGDCAAPKLLQYAYEHQLKPIALAEFWWGKSPTSEIRKNKNYYPACKGKCQPILTHMLQGLDVEESPLQARHDDAGEIKIVYEDDYILAINKPINLLSAPGRNVEDSVYTRLKNLYPEATGPIIIHRLDMGTSGILLCAKTKKTHKLLQEQFRTRFIKKKYCAILNGILQSDSGEIDLPLIVDWNHRPTQMVCQQTGKPAKTLWEKVEEKNGKTRVHFFPVTGRTHQLRVHSAHVLGLESPILGDKLYGTSDQRMYLHAQEITFEHPITREVMHLSCLPDF